MVKAAIRKKDQERLLRGCGFVPTGTKGKGSHQAWVNPEFSVVQKMTGREVPGNLSPSKVSGQVIDQVVLPERVSDSLWRRIEKFAKWVHKSCEEEKKKSDKVRSACETVRGFCEEREEFCKDAKGHQAIGVDKKMKSYISGLKM
ncbi:MAG: hypothetical protein OXT65_01545 [Alphaproteobacteria bacterium]|nr:hypothetical protein [Alphaproteobacteria bacterium]